jgi:ion channel-forming bestrophin family protein
MIRYNPKKWFSLIFRYHKNDTLRLLLPTMALVGVYTTLLTYIGLNVLEWKFASTTAVHSLMGIVLGLILVFRTNTAYERWYEGRRLLGLLVNDSRNLALKMNAFLPEHDSYGRRFFSRSIANYVYALKGHLRDKVNLNEMEPTELLTPEMLARAKHVPNIIANSMYTKCNQLYRQGVISGDQFIILDKEMKTFTDVVGACERIKRTPIPFSYNLFMKKFIFFYIMTMPLGFVTSFEYFTIPVVMFVFYVLVSIEIIAEEIEDPFGVDANDLPVDEITLRIKQNVKEILIDRIDVISVDRMDVISGEIA